MCLCVCMCVCCVCTCVLCEHVCVCVRAHVCCAYACACVQMSRVHAHVYVCCACVSVPVCLCVSCVHTLVWWAVWKDGASQSTVWDPTGRAGVRGPHSSAGRPCSRGDPRSGGVLEQSFGSFSVQSNAASHFYP